MVIVLVKRKFLRAVIASIFIFLFAFSVQRCIAIAANKNYQNAAAVHKANELDIGAANAFWVTTDARRVIEIFDIEKEGVTKIVPVNDSALAEAKKILKGITGVYLKVHALPEKGRIIKIPFEQEVNVKNRWFNDYHLNPLDKMFIILPEEDAPYLLVLDHKERPYLFNFKGDTGKLLKSLEIVPG